MKEHCGLGGNGPRLATALVAAVSAIALLGAPALAQKKAAAGAKKQAPQSAWVKLCERTKLPKLQKDGKTTTVEKSICLTHHERLNGNTGMVIISAALRQVEGQKGTSLMVMVPLGMAIPPGIKAAVYNKQQWARAQKKEKVSDKELKPISLRYSLCHPAGCTAEIKAPDNLIQQLKGGGGLMILALSSSGRPVAFPVPLTGFTAAHDGKPVDNKAYSQARARLMGQIRERLRQKIVERRSGGQIPAPKQATKKN